MAIRKIVSRSIGTDVIAAEDLANNSVTVAEITDGAVTEPKIGSGAVTLDKLSATGTKDATTFLRGDNSFQVVDVNTVTGDFTVDTDVLVVDSTNDRVAIGTTTPDTILHLKDDTANDGPVIRLEGSGSNDENQLIGGVEWENTDTSGDGPTVTGAIRHHSANTTGAGGYTTFHTHDGSEGGEGSDAPERMRLDSSGNLLVGMTSTGVEKILVDVGDTPNHSSTIDVGVNTHGLRLQTNNNDDDALGIFFSTGGDSHLSGITGNRTASASSWETHLSFFAHQSGTSGLTEAYEKMRISGDGNIGAPNGSNIYNPSDERLKQNIHTLTNALDKVNNLRGVSYNWKNGFCSEEQDKTMYGFIAQEVRQVDTNIIEEFAGGHDIKLSETETIQDPLRVNEKYVVPLLVEAIKEQQTTIEALTARIETLEQSGD